MFYTWGYYCKWTCVSSFTLQFFIAPIYKYNWFLYADLLAFVLGVPKTTIRFEDSLEELREFRKAVLLTITLYYSERMYIKISKGNRHMETRSEIHALFYQWSQQHLILPAMTCDNAYKEWPTRGVCLSLGVQDLIFLGVSNLRMENVTDLSYSISPASLEVEMIQHGPRSPP